MLKRPAAGKVLHPLRLRVRKRLRRAALTSRNDPMLVCWDPDAGQTYHPDDAPAWLLAGLIFVARFSRNMPGWADERLDGSTWTMVNPHEF